MPSLHNPTTFDSLILRTDDEPCIECGTPVGTDVTLAAELLYAPSKLGHSRQLVDQIVRRLKQEDADPTPESDRELAQQALAEFFGVRDLGALVAAVRHDSGPCEDAQLLFCGNPAPGSDTPEALSLDLCDRELGHDGPCSWLPASVEAAS